jgi:hypothetical protein
MVILFLLAACAIPKDGLYAYLPTGSEIAFSASISPAGSRSEVVGTRFDEIVTISDSDTFEEYLGAQDLGPVVRGNVSDLTISPRVDSESQPISGAFIYRGTSAVSDSSLTYTYTRQSAIPLGYTSPCDSVDVYRISDHTDPNKAHRDHLLKDSGEITLSELVTVRSS